jgi:subtilisin family serine protease
MTVTFPSIRGEKIHVFQADLDGSGICDIELWDSDGSPLKILRWQAKDEPKLFSEAIADRLIVIPKVEVVADSLISKIQDAVGHAVSLEDHYDSFFILKVEESALWGRFEHIKSLLEPVADVEPEFIIRLISPIRPSQKGPAGDELDWIGAAAIWSLGIEDDEARVAVIDSGVDLEHPSLKDRLAYDSHGSLIGLNLIQNGSAPSDDHRQGHGTFCAGLIAGEPGHAFRGGVLRKGKVIPIKAFDRNGISTSRWAALGIDFAVNAGAEVISASWVNLSYSSLLHQKIAKANDAGCLFVTAAGNYGIDLDICPIYPACYKVPNVLVVGGLSDKLLPVKEWGWGQRSVHMFAPGETVLSTEPVYLDMYDPFQELSGTSAATALVAGAAALVQRAAIHYTKTKLGAYDLKQLILGSTERLGSQYHSLSCSGGYLNLRNAAGSLAGTFRLIQVPSCL